MPSSANLEVVVVAVSRRAADRERSEIDLYRASVANHDYPSAVRVIRVNVGMIRTLDHTAIRMTYSRAAC